MTNIILTSLLLVALNENPNLDQGLMHSKSASRYEVKKEEVKTEDALSFFGKLRTAYIYRDDHTLSHNTNYATAIGGEFGLDTRSYEGLNLHLSAYTSVEIDPLTGEAGHKNKEFFNADGGSYVYLGEANLAYKIEGFEALLGRIKIDTPFADSDDVRMSPNTFEGVWAYKELSTQVSMQAFYLSRMAGSDSAGSQDEFDRLYSDNGFGLVGISLDYGVEETDSISLWYYYADKMSHIFYTEANYELDFNEDFHLTVAAQASSTVEIDESGIDGDVVGFGAVLHYKQVFFGSAYNYAFVKNGQQITDGFGGGAYYTSLDEATVSSVSSLAVGEDVQGYRVGIGYESLFLKDLVLELIHGHLQSQLKTVNIEEDDIILTYEVNDDVYFEIVAARYEQDKGQNKFERFIMRLDYSF